MRSSILSIFTILATPSLAHIQDSRFPGYGFSWYAPACGFSCYSALSGAPLICTSMDHSGGHDHSHGSGPTTPECRANDSTFLKTLAYCMDTFCPSTVSVWQREKFWSLRITGDESVLPKWPYTTSLAKITETPTLEFNSSNVLNETAILPQEEFDIRNNFNIMFDHIEGLQVRYM